MFGGRLPDRHHARQSRADFRLCACTAILASLKARNRGTRLEAFACKAARAAALAACFAFAASMVYVYCQSPRQVSVISSLEDEHHRPNHHLPIDFLFVQSSGHSVSASMPIGWIHNYTFVSLSHSLALGGAQRLLRNWVHSSSPRRALWTCAGSSRVVA